MKSSHSSHQLTFRGTLVGIQTLALLLFGLSVGTAPASAAEETSDFWDALSGGSPTLNLRGRIEIADRDGSRRAEAYTVRTRLGYGTKAWHGASIFAEFENVAAIAQSQYTEAGLTPIADPTVTEVNQAFMKYANKDLLDTTVIGGRQRIKLDDDRWIGNVGWRQNEQTYDAALLSTALGVDKLDIKYGFLGYIRKIDGTDWRSRSHIINASYAGLDFVQVTAFAYLLDFPDLPAPNANSTKTFGLRANGKYDISDDLNVGYQASYAFQQDWKKNTRDYDAHYLMGDVNAGYKPLGTLGVGYEHLGSDDGKGSVVTPLATGHKFNGWADLFLNGNATNGLRDIYVYVAPKLPWKLKGKLVYHHFRTARGSNKLGNEFDAILMRPINKYLSVLVKSAYFKEDSTLPDIYRIWLQATVEF